MKEPEKPENEPERLKDLEDHQLVGLEEDEDYDFITSMASRICGTKISLITLVTEHKQWFLSHHGLDLRETPRDYSFCAHAIGYPGEPLIIEDARKDERFHDNPLTTDEPHVVFYAGVPLVSTNGFPLGTLCAIDDSPKKLNTFQLQQLQKLAKQTAKLFENNKIKNELKHLNGELKKKNQLLEVTQEANQLGTWEMDARSGEMTWSQIVYDIHEVKNDFKPQKDDAIAFCHPDYREALSDSLNNCITHDIPFDLVCQMTTAKEKLIWVRVTGRKVGHKLIGGFQDITYVKHEENKYKSIVEGTNVGTWEWNVQTGETVYNERWAEIVGYTLAELAPVSIETWKRLAHPDDLRKADHVMKDSLKNRTDCFENEIRMKHKAGHWVWVFTRSKVFEWTPEGKPLMMYGTHLDITNRKKEEEIRNELINRFKHLGDQVPGIIYQYKLLSDGTSRFPYASSGIKDIFGLTAEEVEQDATPVFSVLHPDDLEHIKASIRESAEKMTLWKETFRVRSPEEDTIWVEGNATPQKQDDDSILWHGFVQDITDQKRDHDELIYNKNLLESLYDQSPIGIALNDFETGDFIDVNNKLLEPSGYSKEEFLSLNYWDLTPKTFERLEFKALHQLKSKGSYDAFEKEMTRKDGTRYPVAIQGFMIKDANGKKLIWSFIRDISHEKESERKQQEAISNLQAILNASKQVSIIATDTKGKITLFNSGSEKLLGYKDEEMLGKYEPWLINHPDELENLSKDLLEKYNRKLNGFDAFVYEAKIGEPSTKEWTYIKKDGSTFPVLLSVNTIIDHDNEIVGYLSVATDISKLKKVEREIKSLLDITNEQNERLRNFAHIVSHNLRSHSSGISGILKIIQRDHPDIYKNELVKHLSMGAENLRKTVDDLTEIFKVNLSKDDTSEVDLNEILVKNIESLNMQIKQANIEIINETPVGLKVTGVPAYLDSIVLNMITNAIKYKSDQRQSYLKIYTKEDRNMVTIFFEDNGLGIDLKKHGDKLFGMYKTFHQHDDSRGLGLFITKNQIVSMGGKIDVESKVNVGTTFKIVLPK